jgi:hypothetical protein
MMAICWTSWINQENKTMEQYVIDIKGFVETDGKRAPMVIRVSCPRRSEEADDWYCDIVAPVLFERPKRILGIDESQAQTLSIAFLKSLLGERALYNEGGQPITL